MSPALDEASQLTPSRFSHLKPTEPTTTTSGITPGRALLDTPPSDQSPDLLNRAQRSRKPSARKAEASESQHTVSKSKGKEPAKASGSKNSRNKSNPSTSKSSTNVELHASGEGAPTTSSTQGQRDDQINDQENDFLDPKIITLVEEFIGQSVSHLSHAQIKTLLDSMPETQASSLETQAKSPPTITKSIAGMGLAGGNRSDSSLHEGSGARAPIHRLNDSTIGGSPLVSLKRSLDTANAAAKPKRVRISRDENDSPTEDESDNDPDLRRRRRVGSPYDDDDDDDDPDPDSDSSLPPLPPPLPQSRFLTTGSQRLPARRDAYATSELAASKTASFTRLPTRTSTNAIASTSSINHSTPRSLAFDAATYVARHPPPKDLNDVNALTLWAVQIAKQQAAQGPDNAPSPSRSYPPIQRTTTTNHIAQAIAGHRSQLSNTGRSIQQDLSGQTSQSSSTGPTPHASTSNSNDSSGPNAGITPSQHKSKRSAKSKLSDYPVIGDIASAAIPYFLATVFAEGAYESLDTFRNWALDAYYLTSNLEFPEYEYEAPPKEVLTIMTRRVTWLRGEVKKRIRIIVEYGYGFRNPAVDRADVKHNRRLAKRLGPDAFHCRDLVPNTDHFEHTQFVRAIGAGLFWDPESLGVAFKDRFQVIPIPAIALILTMMQACIDEWREGCFKAGDLDADKQEVEFERHVLGLYQYEAAAGPRLTRFRKNWFVAGLEYSGAKPDEDPNVVRPYVLASDIRPATPPPEHGNNNNDVPED